MQLILARALRLFSPIRFRLGRRRAERPANSCALRRPASRPRAVSDRCVGVGTVPPAPLLSPPTALGRVPVLDEDQQRVVDHAGGPLLVLAGPGTGKTTTLVEAIVERIDGARRRPRLRARADLLPQGRRAAARPGQPRAWAGPPSTGVLDLPLLRLRPDPALRPAELYAAPAPAALRAPSRTSCSASCSAMPRVGRLAGRLAARVGTRGFAREVQAVLARAREKGLDGEELRASGRARGPARAGRRGALPGAIPRQSRQRQCARLRRPDPPGGRGSPSATATSCALASSHVFVDEYQDTDPGQVGAAAGDRRRRPRPGRGRRSRTSRSTPSAGPRCAGSSTSRQSSRASTGTRAARSRAAPRPAASAQRIAGRGPAGRRRGCRLPGAIDAAGRRAFRSPTPIGGGPRTGRGAHLRHRPRRGRAPRRPAASGPPRGRRRRGSQMAVLVRSGRTSIPLAARGPRGPLGSRSRWPATTSRWCASPPVLPLLDALRPSSPRRRRRRTPPTIDAARPRPAARPARRPRRRRRTPASPRPLRRREKAAAAADDRLPAASRGAGARGGARDRASSTASTTRRWTAPGRWRGLLARARATPSSRGATAEEVLWALWSGTGWPERLRRAGELGGAGGPARPPRPRLRGARSSRRRRASRGARRGHLGRRGVPRRAWSPSRSPPTRSPSRGVRGARCGCSRPTDRRGWSGSSSSWPTSSRTPGPIWPAALDHAPTPTGSAAASSVPPMTAARAARRRSAGCSTSPAPARARGWW